MKKIFDNDWQELLEDEFEKEYYKELRMFLIEEYQTQTIYPKAEDIYNALHWTPYENVKVVIFGQDPYHGPNQAQGLSFSVQEGVRIPPSLRNIYKELNEDLGCYIPNHGSLKKWAEEGVLLLNSCLTVRGGQPNSHKGKGWEKLTERITEILNDREDPIVFILWGNDARAKKRLISNPQHHIIESFHPSPFAANRGFFGSRPFSRANKFLEKIGKEPIDWQIENI